MSTLLDFAIIKLTIAYLDKSNQEIEVGDTIHISLHRTQSYHKVKSGSNKGSTRFIMNSESKDYKLVYYVKETPREIREQVEGTKSKSRQYDDED